MHVCVLGLAAAVWAFLPGSAVAATSGVRRLAHHPNYVEGVFEPCYSSGCTGHDEPELALMSSKAGSARDFTWTAVLPRNGVFPVDATGPTFWFGGTVTDPDSLFGQAFLELQFYPNSVVTNCNPNGGYVLKHVVGAYSACSPVWSVRATGQKPNFHEPAAFNAMLTRDGTGSPLVMHEGDTVRVHMFTSAAKDGFHMRVTDVTSGAAGTIVLDSASGPLMPYYSVQKIGNSLGWGIVHDTPNSFVWEIGHTSPFTSPASAFCWPGNTACQSYNAPAWAGTSPIRITSVTLADGSSPQHWGVVSDYGGKAEITDSTETGSTCTAYGGPFCIYPWFTQNQDGSWSYGVDYPTTARAFGRANQFPQTLECGGPFGPNSTYCMNVLR